MAQNDLVAIPSTHFTRADFTAMRAYLNKIPLERITDLYYTEDALAALCITSVSDLRCRIETLRDTIIARATIDNPHIAEMLHNARRTQHWSRALVDHLLDVGEQDASIPRKTDPLSAWLKPRVAAAMKQEGVRTLAQLVDLIGIRGTGWWKPIPRIGQRKATTLVNWLRQHEVTLGGVGLFSVELIPAGELVVLDHNAKVMMPLDRVTLPTFLSGQHGENRNSTFPLIAARNDLEAIEAYLYKYRSQARTRRAYQKELERFLLWCIYVCKKPMSSMLVDECEAYKNFLADLPAEWVGQKCSRKNTRWKPFSGKLSTASQRYAVQVIRSFFEWLVRVRYLAGNPWIAVSDPRVAQEINAIQIEKALSAELWGKLLTILNGRCDESEDALRVRYKLRGAGSKMKLGAQFRLARAAILLLGDSGMRRQEAVSALRSKLKPVQDTPGLWELDVLGKRNKWRTVFLPARTAKAIEAHWQDRCADFTFGMVEIPLLSPVAIPKTKSSDDKFGHDKSAGFTPDGLCGAVKSVLSRVANDIEFDLDEGERAVLRAVRPHALRHTFGTLAAAGNVPLDVLQKILGHASLQTTTIYVQAEKKRSIDELSEFFRLRE